MKLTDYIIIFFIIFGCFGLVTFYNTNLNSKTEIAETEYANALAVACHDAARTIQSEKGEEGVWSKPEDREYTLNVFYNTLNFCFNTEYTEKSDETKKYTPIVCLIDNNGYYLSYNTVLDHTESVYIQDDSGGLEDAYSFNSKSESNKDKKVKAYYESMIVTPINVWAENYGKYKVRFYLNDTIDIITPSGETYHDTYRMAAKAYKEKEGIFKSFPGDSGQKVPYYTITENGAVKSQKNTLKALFENKLVFRNVKNKVITQSITDEVNYYINNQNIYNRDAEISYDYYMPDIPEEDWHRLLENPTIISFLQGRQASTGEILSNIYSIGGGEITKKGQYYITKESDGVYVYHYIPYVEQDETKEFSNTKTDECHIDCNHTLNVYPETTTPKKDQSAVNNVGNMIVLPKNKEKTRQVWKCDGVEILHFFESMEDCAKIGATPCECVKNHN